MKNHIIDETSGFSYTLHGDYYLPNFVLPPETDDRPIGIWGRRHRDYLIENKKAVYSLMRTRNTLHSYLADINEQANEMFDKLVRDMKKAEGVTEELKAKDQMAWVGAMENIRNRATEIVNNELIYI
ncbi:MAG: TnpV protein [Clostridia bacterium]|nr:TnpV protein [Clostridia bacterium]